MFLDKHTLPLPIKQFLINDVENRRILCFSLLAILVQFFVFKRMYPFPNFLPDSYSYIETAYWNFDINTWPVGYSKFLRFISVFNYTGMGLFFVQYVLLQVGILFFVFSISFLLKPGRWAIRILAAFLVLNPLWLYVSDFVSSDALFASLSILWLTTLCWILYKPGIDLLIIHGLILFFVFSVRYNALYYPVFSIAVILFSRAKILIKAIRLVVVCLPVLCFVAYTTRLYNEKYETNQFSPFGGWQLASNAMYMYSHVAPKSPKRVPASLRNLHELTLHHMDSLNHLEYKFRPDNELGVYYLWDKSAPMKSYLFKYSLGDSNSSYLKRWAKLAPLYKKYGTFLIKNYPIEFAKYFLFPNLVNYYSPSTEFLGVYNMEKDSIDIEAVNWFKYKTRKIHGYSKDNKITVTGIFPTLLAIINVIFISGFIGFSFMGGFRQLNLIHKQIIFLLLFVWCTNLVFSVVASPIVLRYQVFPFIFTSTFVAVFLDHLLRERSSKLISEKHLADDSGGLSA